MAILYVRPSVSEAGSLAPCREWTTDGQEWMEFLARRKTCPNNYPIFHRRIGFRVRQQHDEAVLRPPALEIDLAVPVFC